MYKLRLTPIGTQSSQSTVYTVKNWLHMRWFGIKLSWHFLRTYKSLGEPGSILGSDLGGGEACVYYGVYCGPNSKFVKLLKVDFINENR